VMPQIVGVIGGGLVFRQVARSVISLVPGLGIVPKVAIAFAGTFAIGEAVYRWCRSGERLSEEGLRAVYALALQRGKALADSLRRLSKTVGGRRTQHRPSRSTAAEEASWRDPVPIELPSASSGDGNAPATASNGVVRPLD